MCFFTFFEFNGHRYNKQAALTLVEYQQRRIDELGQARKHARLYKAELDRLKEKAPVRGKGGRFVSKKKPC